jgi:hypothetical protein
LFLVAFGRLHDTPKGIDDNPWKFLVLPFLMLIPGLVNVICRLQIPFLGDYFNLGKFEATFESCFW